MSFVPMVVEPSNKGDRDYAMTAVEAKVYGLIDEIMEKRPECTATL